MLNIVLFGPPGAGKGTQANKLIDKYGLAHLSTGDIFRANIKGETELGKLAKSFMDKGELVPDEVTIKMLESEVNSRPEAKGFIFDGFPRTNPQAVALENLLESKSTSVTLMLAPIPYVLSPFVDVASVMIGAAPSVGAVAALLASRLPTASVISVPPDWV